MLCGYLLLTNLASGKQRWHLNYSMTAACCKGPPSQRSSALEYPNSPWEMLTSWRGSGSVLLVCGAGYLRSHDWVIRALAESSPLPEKEVGKHIDFLSLFRPGAVTQKALACSTGFLSNPVFKCTVSIFKTYARLCSLLVIFIAIFQPKSLPTWASVRTSQLFLPAFLHPHPATQ